MVMIVFVGAGSAVSPVDALRATRGDWILAAGGVTPRARDAAVTSA